MSEIERFVLSLADDPLRLAAAAASLTEGAARKPGDVRPTDSMTWQFYGGTIDSSGKPTRENMIFFFGMEPSKLMTMMDGIDEFSAADRSKIEAAVKEMEQDPRK